MDGRLNETEKLAPRSVPAVKVAGRLSVIDRLLPLWIFAAMGLGVALGRIYPSIGPALDTVKVGGVSLPIAVGLFWMMYPVLAKVRYGKLGEVGGNGKLFTASLLFNWVVGPLVMFTLAWLLLPDLPHYRTGLILIGLARCIAMVLIWNMLARGSNEVAALLVALNSVFQILFYSVLGWFYLTVVPGWLGAEGTAFHVSMWDIAKSVLLFLGVPLAAGAATRGLGVRRRGSTGTRVASSPRSGRPRFWGSSTRSSSCSRCRGTRSSGCRSTSCGSRSPSSSTSRSCSGRRS